MYAGYDFGYRLVVIWDGNRGGRSDLDMSLNKDNAWLINNYKSDYKYSISQIQYLASWTG